LHGSAGSTRRACAALAVIVKLDTAVRALVHLASVLRYVRLAVGARRLFTYVVLVVVPLAGLAAILRAGVDGATTALTQPALQGPAPTTMALLLVQTIAIVVAARLAGALLSRMGQPRVVGEMLAGVALGPSLLGWLAPAVSAWLFPAESLGSLAALSQLGLLVYIFLVGLELDTAALRANGRAALVISHASITVPFLLGGALAVWLYPRYAEGHAPFRAFALYLGAATSVTAFPVLARIVSERGLVRTHLGSMAIACAAVDDVTAWLLLALVVVVARAEAALGGVAVTAMSTLAYAGAVLWLGRPALRRLLPRIMGGERITPGGLSAVVLVLLASAAVTEMLGVHALFGAFLAGAAMPRDARLREALQSRLQDLVLVLLLPIFFALTWLRTDFGSSVGSMTWPHWASCSRRPWAESSEDRPLPRGRSACGCARRLPWARCSTPAASWSW
jgi:Kef-type K+ transport system membrane component KefB